MDDEEMFDDDDFMNTLNSITSFLSDAIQKLGQFKSVGTIFLQSPDNEVYWVDTIYQDGYVETLICDKAHLDTSNGGAIVEHTECAEEDAYQHFDDWVTYVQMNWPRTAFDVIKNKDIILFE